MEKANLRSFGWEMETDRCSGSLWPFIQPKEAGWEFLGGSRSPVLCNWTEKEWRKLSLYWDYLGFTRPWSCSTRRSWPWSRRECPQLPPRGWWPGEWREPPPGRPHQHLRKDIETGREKRNNVACTVPSESWTHLGVVVVRGEEGDEEVKAAGFEREDNIGENN